MPDRTERTFAGNDGSPAQARKFATAFLDHVLPRTVPAQFSHDIELVVSELVTNAIRASSATVVVGIEYDDSSITVRVRDQAGGWPRRRTAQPQDTSGRGLALVSAIASRWGVRMRFPGKTVWAELNVPA